MSRQPLLLMDGQLVAYEEARIHVLSSAVKYASGVFDGLRAYWNAEQGELYVFRMHEHMRRLRESAKIARMTLGRDTSLLGDDLLGLIRANGSRENLHIRVQVLVDEDDGRIGGTGPVVTIMSALPLDRYFDRDGLDVGVSSWARVGDRSVPPRVKAIANYHNSRLALLQAKADGYQDAIMLTGDGRVAEGPGYNIFLVREGRLLTPRVTDGILEGITRNTLMQIAREDLHLDVDERAIDRTELYVADEAFFCGSAAEVTPILSVDRIKVGTGGVGEVTSRLRLAYLELVQGRQTSRREWLTPVYGASLTGGPASVASQTANGAPR